MWGALGSLAGGLLGVFGQSQANKANANLNRVNRKWNAKEQRLAEKRAERQQIRGEVRNTRRAEAVDRRSDRRDEKYQIRAENREVDRFEKYSDPQWMRDRAEAAGFNPLLFAGQQSYGGIGGSAASSGMSGGGGYSGFTGSGQSSNPAFTPMSSVMGGVGEMVANGFASLDEANFRAEELALRETALLMENNRLQEVAQNARFGPTGRSVLAETTTFSAPLDERAGTVGATMEGGAPPRKPAYDPKDLVPIYTSAGQLIQVPKNWAASLDLRPFDTAPFEAVEAFYGDSVSEVSSLAGLDTPMSYTGFNPLFSSAKEGSGWDFSSWDDRLPGWTKTTVGDVFGVNENSGASGRW